MISSKIVTSPPSLTGALNARIGRRTCRAMGMLFIACVALLMQGQPGGAASDSTQANTIVFSPGTVSLDNPVTAKQQGTPTQFTLALNVYDENGVSINPSTTQPVQIRLYGVPKGVITPTSALVTTADGINFSYNGKYFPNPITVEAYMKLSGPSAGYAIGVTQILPQQPVSGFGARSFGLPFWCDNQTDQNCTESIIDNPLKFLAAVGYSNPSEDQLTLFTLDTGSLGVIVPSNSLGPDAIGPAGKGVKFYNSSGNTYEGNYYLAPVTISVTLDGNSTLVNTFPIKVLAIDNATCAPGYETCEEKPPKPDLFYMGIGFDRNGTTSDDGFDSPAHNAFLQIATDSNGTDVNPGYMLTKAGGVIGITKAATKGFNFAQLTANTSVPGDWNATPGCFGFPNVTKESNQFCGSLLVDVGIAEMFIDLVPHKRPPSVVEPDIFGTEMPNGTVMSVLAGTPGLPVMQYRFTYELTKNPQGMAPTEVKWINPNPPEVFVNTGRNVLKGFNYLFDARHGTAGFEPLVSLFVPVVTTQFPNTEGNKYRVYVSNGGGPAHPVVVDTGSQIMVVPVQYVGPHAQAVKPTECHKIRYDDNTTWCGRFYSGPVTIGVPADYSPGEGTYATTQESFRFLVADPNDLACIKQLGHCKMPSDLTNTGIMGIGFGQGSYGTSYNAMLQVEGVAEYNRQPGYIVQLGRAAPGITVGLTPDNTQGFDYIPLSHSTRYSGQWDPNSFKGCVSFSTSDNSTVFSQCANMLFDTGTVDFTLWSSAGYKPPQAIMNGLHDIDPGTKISITLPTSPVTSYSYPATTATSWPTEQTSVSWWKRKKGLYFTIGQYVFMQYDYLFDPVEGRIGFKPIAQ